MAHSPALGVKFELRISRFGISSEIERKFEHASTTGLLLSQSAFRFGKGIRKFTISLGFKISLLNILISSVYSGNLGRVLRSDIPRSSRLKVTPPLASSELKTDSALRFPSLLSSASGKGSLS